MTHPDPATLNREIRALTTPKACGEAFRTIIADFGFDTFACGQLDLQNLERNVFYIIEWPDNWTRFYRESGMLAYDPIVSELAKRPAPFTWSELRADRKLSKAGSEALALAASFGWNEGLVVQMPQGGSRYGLVSMAGNRPVTTEVRDFLALVAVCLYTHVRTLVAREGCALPPAGLTPREMDCLVLIAKGLSDHGIAQTLAIAPSTAHEHVEKAKRKLKARSRAELLAVAVSMAIVAI